MSFTSQVIVCCLVLPGLVSGGFACLAIAIAKRSACTSEDKSNPVSVRGGLIAAIGWCLAMAVAMGLRQWRGSEQEWLDTVFGIEAWQQILWPMFLFAGVLAIGRVPVFGWNRRHDGSGRYVAATAAACAVAFVVLPDGEDWADLFPLHRSWFALTVVSCLANAWMMERLVRSGGENWVLLVLLAGLGVPAILGAVNYAAPAEWTFAAIAATASCLLVSWASAWRKTPNAIWTIVYPGSAVIASMTTTARFYTYEDYPTWIYLTSLFLPSLVVLADVPFCLRGWKWRVPVAAVVSSSMIAAGAWQLLGS